VSTDPSRRSLPPPNSEPDPNPPGWLERNSAKERGNRGPPTSTNPGRATKGAGSFARKVIPHRHRAPPDLHHVVTAFRVKVGRATPYVASTTQRRSMAPGDRAMLVPKGPDPLRIYGRYADQISIGVGVGQVFPSHAMRWQRERRRRMGGENWWHRG
jgi:hypothetical protein